MLLTTERIVKLTDFGLAKEIIEQTRTITLKGLGTYPYMAPEIWSNKNATISSDIYALGVVFFELCTGERPFQAQSDREKEWEELHNWDTIPNVKDKNKNISQRLNNIIKKMLAKNPADRYTDVEELENSLEKIWGQKDTQVSKNVISQYLIDKIQKTDEEKEQLCIQQLKAIMDNKKIMNNANYAIKLFIDDRDEYINTLNSKYETPKFLSQGSYKKGLPKTPLQLSGTLRSYLYNNNKINITFFPPFAPIPNANATEFLTIAGYIEIDSSKSNYLKIGNSIGKNIFYMQKKDSNYGSWWSSEANVHPLAGHVNEFEHKALTNFDNFKKYIECALRMINTIDIKVEYKHFEPADFENILEKI